MIDQAEAAHRRTVTRIRDAYAALPPGVPVRLAKRSSNIFRYRDRLASPGLDVRDLNGVIGIDAAARTADVQGMTAYEDLVAATLRHGLMPRVVPQLKTITLGGAVTGLGIESSSFRCGMPHESVIEMEILTGAGEIVLATRDNEHSALFHGFPNSYGTLGYALRLKVALDPVKAYVVLRHVRCDSIRKCAKTISEICTAGTYDGTPVDFLDGTVFGPDEAYLTVGTFTDSAPHTSDYTGSRIYYRSIRERAVDHLTVHDYLWRWDTDWFWCSRDLGLQNRFVRALWPRSKRRSDVYRRLTVLDHRLGLSARLNRMAGRPAEDVVQDVEIPVGRLPEYLEFFDREIGIPPVWLCPLRALDHWPLYGLDPKELYVNVGFWSPTPLPPGGAPDHHNRLIEAKVAELGGRKALYSTSFYTEDEFWRYYDGDAYRALKKTYDPDGRLFDLYDKCVRGR
jgi:FAD/FMN-containing dehydrogenase